MEIISIIFGAVLVAVFVWMALVLRRHYISADQPVRLTRMLARLGLSAEKIAQTELADHLPTAARQCSICGSGAACDHVLADTAELNGPPDFCPNASFIRLAKQTVHTN